MAYTITESKDALAQIDIGDSPSVYLTSRMFSLGFLADGDTKDKKLSLLYDAVRERVGEQTTITCSTANWSDINESYVFDHDNQPSREGALRSIHPVVNR